jgi:hypothetical protein
MAVAELLRLGICSFVLSPESDLPNALTLLDSPLQPEMLVYQHVPLFISETAPCVEGVLESGELTFTDRRGNVFITQPRDRRWVTTASEPLDRTREKTELPFSHTRIDLSWSPKGGRDWLVGCRIV